MTPSFWASKRASRPLRKAPREDDRRASRMEPFVVGSLTESKEDPSSSDSMESIHEEAVQIKRGVPMIKRLNEFRTMCIGCDVTFLVGPKQRPIFGHKLLLACSSEVFKAMFYGLLSEFPHNYPPRAGSAEEGEEAESASLSSSVSSEDCFNDDDVEEDSLLTGIPPSFAPTQLPVFTERRFPPPIETVNVPDINPSAFRKMIDFIYNDFDAQKVHLTDNNVMEVLYAAKKYAIDALVDECVRYLLNDLTASNAVFLLSQAILFHEETLINRCLEVIDRNTDLSLQAQCVEEVDRDTLIEVIGRTQLDPGSELVVFNAARNWAKAECLRNKVEPTKENLREALGPALKLIRYPLMNVEEFGLVATSGLLTNDEVAEVFIHLAVKPPPACRYPSGFRCSSRSKHVVGRFGGVSSKRCSKRENKVSFSVDRDIQLYGLGIYGMHSIKPHSEEDSTWRCQVEIQLCVVSDHSSYTTPLGVIASNTVYAQGLIGDDNPLLISFQDAVTCSANQNYVASMRFISEVAVHTVSGKDGKDAVTVPLPFGQQVTFKFNGTRNLYGDDGFKSEGQIPSLHFYVQWPEKDSTHIA